MVDLKEFGWSYSEMDLKDYYSGGVGSVFTCPRCSSLVRGLWLEEHTEWHLEVEK